MTAARPARRAVKPAELEFRLIALDQIDEPAEPLRETMDEQLLAELADSITAAGLQQAIKVKETGERYQVIAGHRRLLACRLAGYSPVPCIIDRGAVVSELAKMLAENTAREDVNPVEEARLYGRLLTEQCGGDVDRLVELARKPRHRVEDRLILLAGDEHVLAAVHHRHISLAVARELNKVDDPNRRLVWLDAAVRGGATARTVMQWRQDAAGLPAIGEAPAAAAGTDGQPQMIQPSSSMVCLFCEDGDDVHLMELLYLHRQCKKFVLRLLHREQNATAAQE